MIDIDRYWSISDDTWSSKATAFFEKRDEDMVNISIDTDRWDPSVPIEQILWIMPIWPVIHVGNSKSKKDQFKPDPAIMVCGFAYKKQTSIHEKGIFRMILQGDR